MIPYGRFEPDKGELEPGLCMKAEGVLPRPQGYGPAPSLFTADAAGALGAVCVGAYSLVKADGTWKVYAFTAADVFDLQSDFTWSSLSASLSVPSGNHVPAIHFGSNLVFTNTADGLNYYNVESPSGFSAVTAAGKPKFIFIWGTQIVGLNCLDSGLSTRDTRLIRVSDYNSFTNWKSGGADYQPLEDGGELRWGCDLQDGGALILQDRAVRFLQAGGMGGSRFSQAKIADGLGSVGARSCATYSGMAFWLASDGFCRYSRSGGIERIGAGRVDDWFMAQADQSALGTVQAGVDPFRKIVWWRYKSVNVASSAVFEDMIGYSFQYDCWVTSKSTTTWLANIATPGTVLDSMDSLYGTIDDANVLVDSRIFQGGQPVFGSLDSVRKFATFSGANQAATLTTSTNNSPVTGLMNRATGLDDCSTGTLELGVKDSPDDTLSWKTGAAKASAGSFPIRGRGMNVAFRRNFPAMADWSYARGVDHLKGSGGGPR